jgi:asparagine synthase (glutamine-hydrolysing)
MSALALPPEAWYAALTRIAALDDARAMMREPPRDSPFLDLVERAFASAPGDHELAKTQAADIAIVLPNDMLTKVDQGSMLRSLEIRVPLLDHRVIETGWSLPDSFKLGSRGGKLVLREIFRQRFGARLADRRKQGFQVPVESWLAGPLAPALDWVFAPKRLARYGLLNAESLSSDRRRSLLVNQPLLLWNAFCLAVWCEVSSGGVECGELREVLSGRHVPRHQGGDDGGRSRLRAVS